VRRLLRTHRAFALVLAAAVIVRVAMAIAYRPALTFVDSWAYIDAGYSQFPFEIFPERPSGYPLLLHLLALPGRNLSVITTVQHLAGLATGVLVYALLLRLGVRRWIAAAAAAIVLLDGYAVTLEQHVLSESLFTLSLTASVYLVVGKDRGPQALAASGALLALAAVMRPTGLLAIPAWVAYVLWTHRRRALLASGLVALALPLVAYAAYHAGETGTVGITDQDGWFLYGRVAPIADCRGVDVPDGTRALCEPPGRKRRIDPDWYVWSADSPARQLSRKVGVKRHSYLNSLLRRFGLTMIRAHPGAYLDVVSGDLRQILTPGAAGMDITIKPPERGTGRCRDCDAVATVMVDSKVRDRWFPGYSPSTHAPAAAVVAYVEALHTARWLIPLVIAIGAIAFGLSFLPRWRGRIAHRRELLLLVGMAVPMLVGTVATTNPMVRYLVPLVPLIVCSGVLAFRDLYAFVGARSRAAARSSSSDSSMKPAKASRSGMAS
jgi:hypothetical protein